MSVDGGTAPPTALDAPARAQQPLAAAPDALRSRVTAGRRVDAAAAASDRLRLLIVDAATRAALGTLPGARARPPGDLGATSTATSTPSRRRCSTASTCCRSASTSSASRRAASRRSSSRSPSGDGVLAFGAHLGSFEALRMIGHEKRPARGDDHVRGQRPPHQRDARGARAARASCTRSRSAASTRCSRSGAGSTKAASPACSPTAALPGNSQRSKAIALPFLGAPARFSGRPVPARGDAAPTGRLHGRPLPRRPRLRSALHRARRLRDSGAEHGGAGERDAAIRAAMQRYVATLEAPVPRGAVQLVQLLRLLGRCRRRRPRARAALSVGRFVAATIASASACAWRCARAARRDAAQAFDLGALTTLLGAASSPARRPSSRRGGSRCSTARCSRRARLSFKAPDSFVRETLKPRHEKLAVDGNTLTMSLGERSRTMQLDASPEAAVIVEAIRGTLTGNRATLERLFETTVVGRRRALVARARAATCACAARSRRCASSGARGDGARGRRSLLADGDRSVMTIEPVADARPAVTTARP